MENKNFLNLKNDDVYSLLRHFLYKHIECTEIVKTNFEKTEKIKENVIYNFEKKNHPVLSFGNERYYGYKNNKNRPDGIGIIYYNNGDKYIGEFNNGHKKGLGYYKYNKEDRLKIDPEILQDFYTGEWSCDSYYGYGRAIYDTPTGRIDTEGEFYADGLNGFGIKFEFSKDFEKYEIDKSSVKDLEQRSMLMTLGYFLINNPINFIVELNINYKEQLCSKFISGLFFYDIINKKKKIIYPFNNISEYKDLKLTSNDAKIPELFLNIYNDYLTSDIRSAKFKDLHHQIKSKILNLMDYSSKYLEVNNSNTEVEKFTFQVNKILDDIVNIYNIEGLLKLDKDLKILEKKLNTNFL